MSAHSHQLRTYPAEDTLGSARLAALSGGSHPLSKSSSSLASAGQRRAEPGAKAELRKSRSSTVCPGTGRADGAAGAANHLPAGDAAQSRATNHLVVAEQCPASHELGSRMCVRSSTAENVSAACAVHPQSLCKMEAVGAGLQRSHSDLTCSCRQQGYIAHIDASAAHATLNSCSSRHGPSVARMPFQAQMYGSEMHEKSHYQNLAAHLPALPGDQRVPTNSYDSSGIPRNAAVYTDPGTFHTAVLGPHVPANGFSSRTMFCQAAGIVQGDLTYSNTPSCAYSAMVVTVHNNCAAPCSTRQESCGKAAATVPAYCHSLPIPSIQLVPRLVCSVSEAGEGPPGPAYRQSFPASDILTYPKLVSSLSESGLDAKRVLKCCAAPGREAQREGQHCAPQGRPPPDTACAAPSSQHGAGLLVKTKDMWTMTSMNDLTRGLKQSLECRDAEVQTLPTLEYKSVATSPAAAAESQLHVFPEVNLQPDLEAPKSPVREVRWDDEGMTWEVYGASVDPEVLGLAIQKHLEIQIEQFQTEPGQPAEKSNEDPSDKEPPSAKESKKRPFRTMMHSLRHPSCCARSSAAVE